MKETKNVNNYSNEEVIDYANTSEFMTFELGKMKYAIVTKIKRNINIP